MSDYAAIADRTRPVREDLDEETFVDVSRPMAAAGFRFRIRCSDPDVAAYLRSINRQYPDVDEADFVYSLFFAEGESGDVGRWGLYLGTERVVSSPNAHLAIGYLLWSLNQEVVKATSDHLVLHASCASFGDEAVILPASMESGKTTTVGGLVQAGLNYVTDEATCINPATGLVTPYPKPLSVDRGSWKVFPHLEPQLDDRQAGLISDQWHIPPDDIRPGSVSGPCRPRLVVSPGYRSGALTRLEPVSRGEAMLMFVENAFNFVSHGERALRTSARVLRECDCYRLVIGDLDDAVAVILDLIDALPGKPTPSP